MTRHVSDGEIHAYLDGELDVAAGSEAADVRRHLEACPGCRGRLDEEARLRERASAVLAAAGPAAGPIPPLEALRARARATPVPARPAPRLARHRRWAWAASVVVALGVGWAVRDRVPAPAVERAVLPDREAAPPGGGAAAADASAAFRGTAAASDATAGLRAPAADVPSASTPSQDAGRGAAPTAPVPDEPESRDAPPPSAPAAGLADVAVRGALSPAGRGADPTGTENARAESTGVESGPAARPAAPESAMEAAVPPVAPSGATRGAASAPADVTVETASAPAAVSAYAPSAAAPPVARSSDAGEAAGSPPVDTATERLLLSESLRRAPAGIGRPRPLPGPLPRRLEPVAARRVREAAAAAAPPGGDGDARALALTVEGLEVLSVVWGEVAPGVRGVRVLQWLEPSDTLDLVIIPGASDDDAAEAALAALLREPLPRGWSRLVRVREDARIVARAPLAPAALSRLLASVGRR